MRMYVVYQVMYLDVLHMYCYFSDLFMFIFIFSFHSLIQHDRNKIFVFVLTAFGLYVLEIFVWEFVFPPK